jgi:transmembrane sensor
MNKPFYDNELPWPLIEAALQGELASEDKLLLDSWLLESPANREIFERLERVWKEGMADYPRYLEADETRAWSEMQARLDSGSVTPMGVVGGDGRETGVVRAITWRRWVVAASALLIIAAGAELWRNSTKAEEKSYATVPGEQQTVALGDGTQIILEPETRVRVAYSKTSRTVTLVDGKASFAVVHRPDQPFEVDMDGASIKDIGTNFTVSKSADSIQITVTEGKVAFTNTISGESRKLAAGSGLVQYMTPAHRGEIKTQDLRFDNAKLSDVVVVMSERYSKRITLADSSLGKKRITVHLEGENVDDAIKVICASLNLESQADSNGYILRNRTTK